MLDLNGCHIRLQALEQRAKASDDKASIQDRKSRQGRPVSGTSVPAVKLDVGSSVAAGDDVYSTIHEDFFLGSAAQLLQLPGTSSVSGTNIVDAISEAFSNHAQVHELKRKFESSIQDKALLLDNPATAQKRSKTTSEKRFTKRLFSRKQQKELGLYNLKKDRLTFDGLIPLHNRWREYIHAVVTPAEDRNELLKRLYAADLHGCLIRVAETREKRCLKVNGIVVRDSKTCFHIVTRDDRLVIVPKQHNVFEFLLTPKQIIVLIGDGLISEKKGFTSKKVS